MAKDRLHRLTLRFDDRSLEAAFQAHAPETRVASIRPVLGFLVVAGVAESLYRIFAVEHGLSAYRVTLLLMYALMAGVVASTFTPWLNRRTDVVAAVVMPLIAAAAIGHVIYTGEDRQRAMLGVFYILVLANVLMPYTHLIQHALGAVIMLALVLAPLHLQPEEARLARVLLLFAVGTASILAYVMERLRRQRFSLDRQLAEERERSEALLLNTLPAPIAERLKHRAEGEEVVDEIAEAAVIFADLVGFTKLAAERPPQATVRLLNDLFSRLDAVAARHGLEKIKTVGDAYMVAAGVPTPRADALAAAAEAAFALIAAVRQYGLLTGHDLAVRVGLHVGPVAAGVIGRHKFQYDLWGTTVNLAARLEATGEPGRVHVLAEVAERLAGRFTVEARGKLTLKGLGQLETAFLEPRRESAAA